MSDEATSTTPATFPREEVEAAFAEFRRRGAGEHDWPGWADLFTEDARYIEHNLGTFHGRDEIKQWIVSCMADYPAMTLDIDWWVIEGNRVAFYIWNLLPDPTGQGRDFAFPNTTVLHYAGEGKWNYEEDYYNPHDAARVFMAWLEAGGRRHTPQDRTLRGIAGWAPDVPEPAHSRQEVEAAFHRYVERGKIAVATGDWVQWAEQFTEDARYREHHYGTFSGRDEITAWITGVMQPFPDMEFPVEWYLIDGNRVTFRCPNVMPDPAGQGRDFSFPVHVILHYAGNDQWSYEEDVYNPDEAPKAIMAWVEAGGQLPPEVLAQLG